MDLYGFLRQNREDVPTWLSRFERGHAFESRQFFASRIVYYPASGTDGHPVKLFGSTHSAHSFMYVDKWISQNELTAELKHPTHHFRGYHTLDRIEISMRDLTWVSRAGPRDLLADDQTAIGPPVGFLEVLERDQELDDSHGARRLAILFLVADGTAPYREMFCRGTCTSPPFAVVVQDYSFVQFGRGSSLECIARRRRVVPKWLLVAENTCPWEGFEWVSGVDGEVGGMNGHPRFLHMQSET